MLPACPCCSRVEVLLVARQGMPQEGVDVVPRILANEQRTVI